jgi:DNA-binding transcriptional LysR family regulator
MKISLDALQLLDAIDVRGSFAGAAAALHRVPSAVTHAVRRLEDDLDVKLFARAGRQAVLTPAGRALLDEGRRLLRAAGELERHVQRVATGWETELAIAVDTLIDVAALFPLIEDFDRAGSGTRLRLTSEVLGGCWDALATGRADLAIGASGDPPPGERWSQSPLGEVPFVFAVAPGHPLADAPEPLAAETVAQHRVIVLADTSRQLLARSVGLADGRDILTVADPASKIAAQLAGLGVGHLPEALARPHVAAGRLCIKRLAEPMPPRQLALAWKSAARGRALAWFVERLATPEWRARLLPQAPGASTKRAEIRRASGARK